MALIYLRLKRKIKKKNELHKSSVWLQEIVLAMMLVFSKYNTVTQLLLFKYVTITF